jgi:transglutaminase-like putative cysteine protease
MKTVAWSLLDDSLVIVAVGVAACSFAPFYGDPGWALPVWLALAGGALIGFVTSWLRWPAGVSTLVAGAGLFVVGIYLLARGQTASGLPGPDALAATAAAFLGGLGRMLTMTPPADVSGEMIAFPLVVTWATAFAAARLTRWHQALAPLLPPLILLVVGLLLTAHSREPRWALTLTFLSIAFLTVLLRADLADPGVPDDADVAGAADAHHGEPPEHVWLHSRLGRVLVGAPVVAGVVVAGVLGAYLLPVASGAARMDVRDLHEQPVSIDQRISPLADVRRQIEVRPVQKQFTVTLDAGGAAIDRFRVAALDRYDGALWTTSARFVRTGSSVPAGPHLEDPAAASLSVTIQGLDGPLLPTAGWPIRVAGEDTAYDRSSGQLVTTTARVRGYRYQLDVVAPSLGFDGSDLEPVAGAQADPYLALPALPEQPRGEEDLAGLAARLTADAATPMKALAALERYLKRQPYDLSAPPGHTYAALNRVLSGTPPAARGVTEEQTATAFAIMARLEGYPTRVAVGYQFDKEDLEAGTFTVSTDGAYAWPEVLFEEVGWMAFDPTGQRRTARPERETRPQSGTGDDPAPESVAPEQAARPGDQGPEDVFGGGLAGRAILWMLIAAVLVPVAGLSVVGAKLWRRNRRRLTGAPADRVAAAWRESTDRLQEHGLEVPLALTTDEVADRVQERFGVGPGGAVATLAPLVTTAVFAVEEPEETTAELAWEMEAELRALLEADASTLQRARSWLDPRPLLPRRTPVYGDQEWHGDAEGRGSR